MSLHPLLSPRPRVSAVCVWCCSHRPLAGRVVPSGLLTMAVLGRWWGTHTLFLYDLLFLLFKNSRRKKKKNPVPRCAQEIYGTLPAFKLNCLALLPWEHWLFSLICRLGLKGYLLSLIYVKLLSA